MSAYIEQFLFVGDAPVTGTARVPDGTTATLTNVQTGRRITLTDDNDFTIPTGVKALLNKSQLSHSESVQCTGDKHSCEASLLGQWRAASQDRHPPAVAWPHSGRGEVAVLTRMRETFAGG